MKKRLAVCLSVLALSTMGRAVAPTHAAAMVVKINEVQTHGAPSTAGFVELFNPGAFPADVGCFTLVYRGATATTDTILATIPRGVTIAPSGYYLFGTSTFTSPVDQTLTGNLSSTGAGVGLRDVGSALVDSVGYGNATNAFVEGTVAPAPATSQSIERTPNGTDTNNNGADFQLKATPTPDKGSVGGAGSCSVGGIAEDPSVASLPMTAVTTSTSHHTRYAIVAAAGLLIALVGGWAVRRRVNAD